MTLSNKIRQRRQELGLAQQDLLHRLQDLGLRRSPPTVRDWEAGARDPRLDELRVLAAALETTVVWLCDEQDDGLSCVRPDDSAGEADELFSTKEPT